MSDRFKYNPPFPVSAKAKREIRSVVSPNYWKLWEERISQPEYQEAVKKFLRIQDESPKPKRLPKATKTKRSSKR